MIPGLEGDFAFNEGANAEFRPLKVHEDANGAATFAFQIANDCNQVFQDVMTAMAEIEPEDIGPFAVQGLYLAGCLACRAKGGNDFCISTL